MINLKPFYDAAQAASGEVLKVAHDIETAFALGTEEGVQRAMAMKSTLDDAEAKAQQANELYLSMQKAATTGDVAAKFVPANADAKKQSEDSNTISRTAFEAKNPREKYDFLQNGGIVVSVVEGA